VDEQDQQRLQRIVNATEAPKRDIERRRGWGPWIYDRRHNVIRNAENGYEVELSEPATAANVLRGLGQVTEKIWAHDSCLAGLVRAFDEVVSFHDCADDLANADRG